MVRLAAHAAKSEGNVLLAVILSVKLRVVYPGSDRRNDHGLSYSTLRISRVTYSACRSSGSLEENT